MLVVLAACTDGGSPTVADTTTTASTGTATTAVRMCDQEVPPFGATRVPAGWDLGLRSGSGGGAGDECDVWHWGGAGRMVDVRPGDAGMPFGPLGSRSITALGRPASIGPIHEGFRVDLGEWSLLGYGITEYDLQRLAEGLYVTRGADQRVVVAVDADRVTVEPIGGGGAEDLPLSPDVVVTSPWAEYGRDGCELCQRVITVDRLRELLADTETVGGAGNVRDGRWWITRHDGLVTRLDQQYVP